MFTRMWDIAVKTRFWELSPTDDEPATLAARVCATRVKVAESSFRRPGDRNAHRAADLLAASGVRAIDRLVGQSDGESVEMSGLASAPTCLQGVVDITAIMGGPGVACAVMRKALTPLVRRCAANCLHIVVESLKPERAERPRCRRSRARGQDRPAQRVLRAGSGRLLIAPSRNSLHLIEAAHCCVYSTRPSRPPTTRKTSTADHCGRRFERRQLLTS